jgi:hypothetical protein
MPMTRTAPMTQPMRTRALIRRIMFNAVAAALITLATAAGGVAMAQESNKPGPAVPDRMEAPIGHRQPRARDLPRNVPQTEGNRTDTQMELDRKLKDICRGC